MDFSSDTHLNRFTRAFEWSRKQLAPFRRETTNINRLLAGSRFGDNATPLSNPVPFLQLLHQTYVRSLVASSPRAMISTRVRGLKPVAHAMEIALNYRIKEMKLAETLRQVVSDALISIGIIKIGVEYSPKEGAYGLVHDYGESYADVIALEDWVMDMTSKRFDQIGYCGHHLRCPKQALLNDPRYKPDQIRGLAVGQRWDRDEWGNDRVQSLSGGFDSTDDGDHEDMVDMWEFWLPRDNLVMVMAWEGDRLNEKPLHIQDYQGPELGPYQLLRFNALSSNIMPAAPLLHMADYHEAMNGVSRKIINQALRQKNITIVSGAQEEDVLRYNQTPDGHAVRGDFGQIGETPLGGINQMNAAFATQMKNDASYFAGNLDSLAGLGPQSQTLGQDRMIAASSSKMVQAMEEETIVFTQNVMEAIADYWVNDKNKTYNAEVPVAGTDMQVPVEIRPEDREGVWRKLNFQIDPYSLQNESPQSKLQIITDTFRNDVIPLAQQMAQQKMAPNIEGYLRLKAKYSNITDMDDLVIFSQPSMDDQEMKDVPRMAAPAQKTTTSVRVNAPGATNQGKDMAMMQTMMGKPGQPAEQAAMTRPVA